MTDNPRLTARIAGEPEWCPIRFVFDGRLRSVVDHRLPNAYSDEFAARTIVVTTQHGGLGYVRKLRGLGVGVWVFESPSGRVPFAQFRARCAEEKVGGVLLEGGAQLLSRALIERQVDYFFAYQAPLLFADEKAKPALSGLRTERLEQAVRLSEIRRSALGDDSLLRGRVVYPEKIQVDETLFSLG